MAMNHNAYRKQISELSDEYARLTGKPGLLYVSRPGDGQARYVFGENDGVRVGGREALKYITALVNAAKR